MGKRVIVNDLDPQRGVWDFAEALGRTNGRILKNLAVVEPGVGPPFAPQLGHGLECRLIERELARAVHAHAAAAPP
jgi:hypothetical protein